MDTAAVFLLVLFCPCSADTDLPFQLSINHLEIQGPLEVNLNRHYDHITEKDNKSNEVEAPGGSSAAHLAQLTSQVQQLWKMAESNVKDLQVHVADLQTRLGTSEGQVEVIQTRLNASESQIEGFETRLNASQSQIEGFETRLNASESQIEVFETRLNASESQVEGFETRLNASESQIEGFEPFRLNTSTVQIEDLSEAHLAQLTTIETRLTAAESQVHQLWNKPKVAFSAGLTVEFGQVGRYRSDTTLIYNNVTTNIGNAYNTSTGKFTAPVRGLYHFTYTVANRWSSEWFCVWMYKNEQRIFANCGYNSGRLEHLSSGRMVELEEGDTVYMRLRREDRLNKANHNVFNGVLLYAL